MLEHDSMLRLAMAWGIGKTTQSGTGYPYLLPGSPRCYDFSIEMGLNFNIEMGVIGKTTQSGKGLSPPESAGNKLNKPNKP
jgi:hypothetical protein